MIEDKCIHSDLINGSIEGELVMSKYSSDYGWGRIAANSFPSSKLGE